MHVEPCDAVFFSLPQVCESQDPHARTVTERGILHLSNLHTTPRPGRENEACLWAEVVFLYPVCGVKRITGLHPTNSKPLRKGRQG